jgi:putative membrane protein
MNDSILPHLNAGLNAASFVLLVAGFYFISRRRVYAHRACMLAALAVSCLFLVSYVVYHAQYGSVRFRGQGLVRPLYFSILISHVTLAAAIVPLVGLTLRRALRGDFLRHRRIARWTYPLWLYVSATGVIVYVMLYRLYPPR